MVGQQGGKDTGGAGWGRGLQEGHWVSELLKVMDVKPCLDTEKWCLGVVAGYLAKTRSKSPHWGSKAHCRGKEDWVCF